MASMILVSFWKQSYQLKVGFMSNHRQFINKTRPRSAILGYYSALHMTQQSSFDPLNFKNVTRGNFTEILGSEIKYVSDMFPKPLIPANINKLLYSIALLVPTIIFLVSVGLLEGFQLSSKVTEYLKFDINVKKHLRELLSSR